MTAVNADLDCCDARHSFVRALHLAAAFSFNFSVLYFYYYKNNLKKVGDGAMVSK